MIRHIEGKLVFTASHEMAIHSLAVYLGVTDKELIAQLDKLEQTKLKEPKTVQTAGK